MKKLIMTSSTPPPDLPYGAPDRLTLLFDDGTSVTHVFGSHYKNPEANKFKWLLVDLLSDGVRLRKKEEDK